MARKKAPQTSNPMSGLNLRQIEPMNHTQNNMFDAFYDGYHIIAMGSAGTGKSIYSLKFIDHQFHYRTTAARACYITKSERY